MAEYTALAPLFTDIANAIRSKTGETGAITASSFPEKIVNINVLDLSQATADLQYYESQKTFYFWGGADWSGFYATTKTPIYTYVEGRMDVSVIFTLIGIEDTYYHQNVDFRWAYLNNYWTLQRKNRLSDTNNLITLGLRGLFNLSQ